MPDPLNDGISVVEHVTYMGDDLMVVNAARVSFHKQSEYEMPPMLDRDGALAPRTGRLKEADVKLISYLAAHGHWTPFAHPQIQLRIKMPLFVAREWYRHTVGFARNEVSRRYVTEDPEFFIPTEWRLKSATKKQGSSDEIHEQSGHFTRRTNQIVGELQGSYEALLMEGVAPELARMILPQNTYTEFIETASLYAYARLCNLRIHSDAQAETRAYAQAVSDIIEPLFPVSWIALTGGKLPAGEKFPDALGGKEEVGSAGKGGGGG